MYDESFWISRRLGLHEIAAGRWKRRFLLFVSLFRDNALRNGQKLRMLVVFGLFSPIEGPEQLRDPFLSFGVPSRGQLYSERRNRTVIPMHTESSPAVAM
jgi:hypothetical protein